MLKILRGASPKNDINIKGKDWCGQTTLLIAIDEGCAPAARLLLKYNADKTIADDDGRLSFLLAAEKGLTLVVRSLLIMKERRGPQGVRDKEGNTVPHVAAAKGNLEVVEILLESGTDQDDINAKR